MYLYTNNQRVATDQRYPYIIKNLIYFRKPCKHKPSRLGYNAYIYRKTTYGNCSGLASQFGKRKR